LTDIRAGSMPPTPLPSTGVGASTIGGGGQWEKPVSADRVTQRRGSIVLVNGAKCCFRCLGCRCVRACRLSCVRTPYSIPNSSMFVVHPRSKCRSRNNHLRSQAVYRELQRPYPAVSMLKQRYQATTCCALKSWMLLSTSWIPS
jgi:hypothetical protein